MSHTPGPWSYVWLGERQFTVDAPAAPLGQRDIAFVKTEDNARLIAAAPELLEACNFASVVLCESAGGPHPDRATAITALITAIAKAEGRS